MTKERTGPKMNLIEALRAAVTKDNLDDACRLLQDVLGVTDGGLAGVSFSDLSDVREGDGKTWDSLPITERHDRLISYLKTEIDFIKNAGEGPEITLPGFSPWHTGGGCMALAKHLPDETYWLVTADDGASIPCEGDHIIVGHHGADGETIVFEADYAWSDFDREDLLARVAASERSYGPYDRDGMVDDNERRSFIEKQEEVEQRAFKAFQETRRQMTSREFGKLIGDAMWEDEPVEKFLVYEDSWWIGTCDDGRHHLVFGNQTWITASDLTLADIEKILFELSRDC